MSFLRLACLAIFSCVPLLMASPALAFCTPDTTSGMACLGATDDTCSTLGVTTMDGDRENLIACLGTSSGSTCASNQCRWKSMTSSETSGRSTFTSLPSSACTFTNSTKNGDVTYNCAIPSNATHLKIWSKCTAIGINGDAKARAYFTPSSEPFTAADPQVLCAEHASSGETSQDSTFHLIPLPKNTTMITVITEKVNNVDDRNIIVSILPLIVE